LGAVGVVVVVALVVALAGGGGDGGSTRTKRGAGGVVSKLIGVSSSVSSQVGAGSAQALPKPIVAPALMSDGKPLVVYLGAEYCPYCAAERWAMVLALSRFGTFTGVSTTHSSSSDVFPSTPTLSFHGASYQSAYLVFQGVEMQGNELSGGSYPVLDTPSAAQGQLFSTYDPAGSIPFVDFGGKYLVIGVTYSPAALSGKSHSQVVSALSKASDPVTKGIVGGANVLTAALCGITGGQPGSVCADPVIRQIQSRLG
jgi:hypothetical protein